MRLLALGLEVLLALSKQLGEGGGLLLSLDTALLDLGMLGTLALQALWGHKTLDLGAADLVLLAILLDGAGNDVLADVYRKVNVKDEFGET